MHNAYDEVVGDALAMMNVVRQAFGKERLNELPNATPGNAADCLFHRALGDIGVVSVNGSHITFESQRVATAVGALWNQETVGPSVSVPAPVQRVISAFDDHALSHYNA